VTYASAAAGSYRNLLETIEANAQWDVHCGEELLDKVYRKCICRTANWSNSSLLNRLNI
jgi:hypothetical protein